MVFINFVLEAAIPEQVCLGPYLMARKPCAPANGSVSSLCHLLFPTLVSEQRNWPIPSFPPCLPTFRTARSARPSTSSPACGWCEWPSVHLVISNCHLCFLFFYLFCSFCSLLCVCSIFKLGPSSLSPLLPLLLSTSPYGLSIPGRMREAGKRAAEDWRVVNTCELRWGQLHEASLRSS